MSCHQNTGNVHIFNINALLSLIKFLEFMFYPELEIRSVERGTCPIAESVMTDSIIIQCARVKLPYL